MNNLASGQVWWADLHGEKARPVVILTRSLVAPLLTRVLVAPVTTTVRGLRTEVELGQLEGVAEGCVANLDNTQLIEVSRLLGQAGKVEAGRWDEFCRAMAHAIGCQLP